LHTLLGQTYLHAGKLQEAETEFHQELQLDSQNEPAWLGLANMQVAKGQSTAALDPSEKFGRSLLNFWLCNGSFRQSNSPRSRPRSSYRACKMNLKRRPKHFLSAALLVAANDSVPANPQWKLFQADFAAVAQADAPAKGAADQYPCKAIITLAAQNRCKPESR